MSAKKEAATLKAMLAVSKIDCGKKFLCNSTDDDDGY